MRQKSLDSLIRTANTAGATVICEYHWPISWPTCWDWHSLTCFLNMKDPQSVLRWELERLIFEAQNHTGGTNRLPNALLEQPCYNLSEKSRRPAWSQKSHPTTPIVEWLLFCAPYRQKLFSPTKPISEKCS